MSAAVGGSVISVTLAGRLFAVAGDADSNRKLGGWENEVQPNGDGTARIIKKRVALMLDNLMLSIDDAKGDQEFLKSLQAKHDFFPVIIEYASGAIYQGTAIITDEVQTGSNATTCSIKLEGPGGLTKQ